LAEVAVQAAGTGGHDDAAVLLLSHDVPYRLGAVDRAEQVHVDDAAKILQRHLGEGLVPQDAGIVHQHVHPAPGVHGLGDHRLDLLEVSDVGAVSQRFTAGRVNLVDHRSGRLGPEVIDHDLCSVRGQRQGVGAAQARAGAGHDGDPIIELDTHY
jgi:hypothetical protein